MKRRSMFEFAEAMGLSDGMSHHEKKLLGHISHETENIPVKPEDMAKQMAREYEEKVLAPLINQLLKAAEGVVGTALNPDLTSIFSIDPKLFDEWKKTADLNKGDDITCVQPVGAGAAVRSGT